jgi:hypothetical protein
MEKFAEIVRKALPPKFSTQISFSERISEGQSYAFDIVISGDHQSPVYEFCLSSNLVEQHRAVMNRLPIFLGYGHQKLRKVFQLTRAPLLLRIGLDDFGSEETLVMDGSDCTRLIPTEFDMRYCLDNRKSKRKSKLLSHAEFLEAWTQKKSLMFWRGITTGGGWSYDSIIHSRRVKVSTLYRDAKDFDIKISSVVQAGKDEQSLKDYLISNNLFSDRVHEDAFSEYRYYPDIPGNVLAWGCILKHMAGCLVFRPENARRLLWYQFMSPWTHYIPVDEEFLELGERMQWAQANPEQAALIAWRGYCSARNYLGNSRRLFQNSMLTNFILV